MTEERSVGEERREHPRLVRPFEGSWRGTSGANKCRIGDISAGGCFVQSLALPSPGESTLVTVNLGPNMSMSFYGKVLYVESGMGFAVQFTEVGSQEAIELQRLLGALGTGAAKKSGASSPGRD
jgi:hypothetical protein